MTVPQTQPTSSRKRGLRRLAAIGVVVLAMIPTAVLIAPTESRWVAAVGFQTFYDIVEEDERSHFGPEPRACLTFTEVEDRLQALRADTCWKITGARPVAASPTLPFAHEDTSHPAVSAFRAETADLVPSPFDPFEVARRVRALTRHETDFDSDDVSEYLAAARSGRRLLCHHFSRLFGAVCTAHGYTTRVISLSAKGDHFDHAVCEIYMPEFRKWIAIDTDFEMAYRKDGQWLNAAEIQREWQQLRDSLDNANKTAARVATNIELVPFGNSEPHLRQQRLEVSPSGLNLELFEFVFIAMRDDYLSRKYPTGHPAKVRQLCFRADTREDFVPVCPEAIFARHDIAYWHVGHTNAEITRVGNGPFVELRFSTRTPRFCKFEIRVDGASWEPVLKATRHEWSLHLGANRFEVRSINAAGLRGAITKLEVVNSEGM